MLRQFFLLLEWQTPHCLFPSGYRGSLGEGENAKEVRPLVVLAKKSGQYNQAGEYSCKSYKIKHCLNVVFVFACHLHGSVFSLHISSVGDQA